MKLKTPPWWYEKNARGAPWWRPVLWPLSLVWQVVNAIKRARAKPYRSHLFVISVGNLTLGGSGKTPITAEILSLLSPMAAGLSKGYGGRLTGPVKVDSNRHTSADVGDEALMLGRDQTFVVSADRAAGLRLIETTGPEIIVVDDAHQNLKIAKDLHLLVIDGDTRNGVWPFGDGGICPYGPLREPVRQGLARADICILWMPDEDAQPDPELMKLIGDKPVFIARLHAQSPEIPAPVFGFAAIAKPWKFEATLRKEGYELAGFEAFPDHADVPVNELELLAAQAEKHKARLITTQKDWVRLDAKWREKVTCLPIRAKFDDEAGFVAALMQAQKMAKSARMV
ncbi:MAG: tetraacyldisaccharide 4'-kinase [Asticcacaulis sp.]